MRSWIYLLIGIFFGIVLYKCEAASWFRIYEMFRFQSFHMYGIMGSALLIGTLTVQWFKRRNTKSFYGEEIRFKPKKFSYTRYVVGGACFGMGWALVGACPGPLFVLLGAGFAPIATVILFALLGTFVYGLLRPYLPH